MGSGSSKSAQTSKSIGAGKQQNNSRQLQDKATVKNEHNKAPTQPPPAGHGSRGTAEPRKSGGKRASSWYELLSEVAKEDLWSGVARAERPEWRKYLRQAEDLALSKTRVEIPQDAVHSLLVGDVKKGGQLHNNTKVIVFISSTFTDTQAERDSLMRDVYPFVRSVCQLLGLEFGTVDMRWGVTEEASNDHSVVQLCENELQRCIKTSCGPAFLCIVSHKYGYRMLPAQIEKSEFETLMAYLINNNKDTELVKSFYKLDKNAVEQEYVLVPVPDTEKATWWQNADEVMKLLREAALECFDEKSESVKKYFVSVTETEIQGGVFSNPNKDSQVIMVQRDLADVASEANLSRKILDMKDGKVDEYAQGKLNDLKERLNNTCNCIIHCSYQELALESCKEEVRGVCDKVCKGLLDKLFDQFGKVSWFTSDPLLEEISQHHKQAADRSALFVGKVSELRVIVEYAEKVKYGVPLVVHGVSGCGKTSLMAVAAGYVKKHVPKAALVLRFLGTTPNSGSARSMVISVCEQISRIYGKPSRKPPNAYKELETYWKECLQFATEDCPLIIFLDSLDQLGDKDMEWTVNSLLLSKLPENVRLVVSMLPSSGLSKLQNSLFLQQILQVNKLMPAEGPEILCKMLEAKGRKIHEEQMKIVMDLFVECPLPLYLRLAADIASRWHSYDAVTSDSVAADSPGMIRAIFERLESKYGKLFVQRALGYITAAKAGLSETELEDILSCDDDLLDVIFKWWHPPMRCLPKLLWARLRSDIGGYLAERGSDGVALYTWYHRQFWETAAERYLDQPFDADLKLFRERAHCAIADYFEDKWANGKMYPDKTKSKKGSAKPKLEPRGVQAQPFKLQSDSGSIVKWNKRKLYELPHHLMRTSDWNRFVLLASDLQYIEGKFSSGYGYDCYKELTAGTRQSGNKKLKQIFQFVGANLAFLQSEPNCVYQLAAQQTVAHPLRESVDKMGSCDVPYSIIRDKKEAVADSCLLTLQGHTSSSHACGVSRNGDYIVSTSEDGSLIVWDAMTGEILANQQAVPADLDKPLKDRNHGDLDMVTHHVNPCCFSPTDDTIAMGTDSEEVILWDVTGIQKKIEHTELTCVTAVQFSPDKQFLATSFKQGSVYIWDAESLEHLHTIQLEKLLAGLDFSPDGKILAVACFQGLAIIDMESFTLKAFTKDARGEARSNHRAARRNHDMMLCCACHPDGKQIMTGSTASDLGVWDASTCTRKSSISGHLAWVWAIRFSRDGRHMYTASSDRSIIVWQAGKKDTWTSSAVLYGHNHRIMSLALDPSSEAILVTSSLDGTLKVWDIASLKSSSPSECERFGTSERKLKYNSLAVFTSARGTRIMSSEGWAAYCTIKIEEAKHKEVELRTDRHRGYIKKAEFMMDGRTVVVLDHGHRGDFPKKAALKAKVIVNSVTEVVGDGMKGQTLNVQDDNTTGDQEPEDGPTAFSVCKSYIVVGTFNGAVILYDISTYDRVRSWQIEGEVSTVASSSIDDHVITATGSNVTVWMASATDVKYIKGPLSTSDSQITISAFSPLGLLFCVGHESGEMSFWNISAGDVTLLTTLTAHKSVIEDMKFCSSGRYLATCGDHGVRVWDVEGDIKMKGMYIGPVPCVAFKEENVLLAGDQAGELHELRF